LDYSAKILIRYCLTQAAQNALNKSLEWVSLAEAAGVGENAEFPLVRVMFEEDNVLKAPDPDEEERERIEGRIKRLESFAEMAMRVSKEMRQKLEYP